MTCSVRVPAVATMGAVATTWLSLHEVTVAATPPMVTVPCDAPNPVPWIVTGEPMVSIAGAIAVIPNGMRNVFALLTWLFTVTLTATSLPAESQAGICATINVSDQLTTTAVMPPMVTVLDPVVAPK